MKAISALCRVRSIPLLLLGAVAVSASPAHAADAGAAAPAEPALPGSDGASHGALALSPPPDDTPPTSLDGEEPEPATYYVGVRYRGLFIPEFILASFMDGAKAVYVNGVGPEFTVRSGSLEYKLSAWMAFYSLDPSAIKGLKDAEEAWEVVESDMKSLYATADFIWHQPLSEGLDLSYGGGAGIGFIFGDLRRTQAYLVDGGTAGNPEDYRPCQAVGTPSPIYCDDVNQHYGGFSEASWSNGGAKPVLYPWLAAQIGLRYQPHPQLATHLELGLGLSGFLLGLSADYGL